MIFNICIFVFSFILLCIVLSNNLFCSIFKRKDRKLWKQFIKIADKFEEVPNFSVPDAKEIFEVYSGISNHYIAYIWKSDNLCSIYRNGTLFLSQFDKKYSKKMVKALHNRK